MAKYINYSDLEPEMKEAKALLDITEFLGAENFANLTSEFIKCNPPPGLFEFLVSLSGIEGYPAGVWYNHVQELMHNP